MTIYEIMRISFVFWRFALSFTPDLPAEDHGHERVLALPPLILVQNRPRQPLSLVGGHDPRVVGGGLPGRGQRAVGPPLPLNFAHIDSPDVA